LGNKTEYKTLYKVQKKSQERLNNIQKNSVVDIYDEDVIGQIREIEKTGNVRSSIAAKLAAIEEDKKAQK
jgi:hypothetical protein